MPASSSQAEVRSADISIICMHETLSTWKHSVARAANKRIWHWLSQGRSAPLIACPDSQVQVASETAHHLSTGLPRRHRSTQLVDVSGLAAKSFIVIVALVLGVHLVVRLLLEHVHDLHHQHRRMFSLRLSFALLGHRTSSRLQHWQIPHIQ